MEGDVLREAPSPPPSPSTSFSQAWLGEDVGGGFSRGDRGGVGWSIVLFACNSFWHTCGKALQGEEVSKNHITEEDFMEEVKVELGFER